MFCFFVLLLFDSLVFFVLCNILIEDVVCYVCEFEEVFW